MPWYVITKGSKPSATTGELESIRGVYNNYASVLTAITGSTDPCFMEVSTQEEADDILDGRGVSFCNLACMPSLMATASVESAW
jgi:hypothetical protein